MYSDKVCPDCGQKMKANKTGHYACKCAKRFAEKGDQMPKKQINKAIKHLNQNPSLFKRMFGI